MAELGVSVGVEGLSDEGVASAILKSCGLSVVRYVGRNGKQSLLKRLPSYNAAAIHTPWVIFVDLDNDGPCAGDKRKDWLPSESPLMRFRIAVHEVEAWLLADQEATSNFLSVSRSLLPGYPETLDDPKAELVSLARRSRKRDIREGLVPRPGSGRQVGPTYASDIGEFARTQWRPRVAAESAPSLERCIARIEELASHLRSRA